MITAKKFRFLSFLIFIFLFSCDNNSSDKQDFENTLSDSSVNSKEVGERNGIKFFQVMRNGKTGFRNLDGKIVIEPIYDDAEMFSEGYSSVEVNKKWGSINEKGKYIIVPKFEYLGGAHNNLLSFREGNEYGFVDTLGKEKINPQFDWVDDFSEGLCVVRNSKGKHGYIDTAGKLIIPFQFDYAYKMENGNAKVELNNLWGEIDKNGKIIVKPTHKYATDW